MKWMTGDEAIRNTVIEMIVILSIWYIYQIFTTTKPAIDMSIAIELFLYVLITNISLCFQRATTLFNRLALALFVGLAMMALVVFVQIKVYDLAKTGMMNADEEAFGLVGSFVNFMYEAMFGGAEKILNYGLNMQTLGSKIRMVALSEAVAFGIGYILGDLPIYNKEDEFRLTKAIAKRKRR